MRLLKQAGNFCGKYPYRQIRAVGADVRHFTGRIFVGSKCFPVRDFAFSTSKAYLRKRRECSLCKSSACPQKVPCQGFFVESGLILRPLSDASGERLRPVRRKESSLLRKNSCHGTHPALIPSENQKQAGNLQKGIARLDHFMLRFFLILRYPLLIRSVR